MDYLEQDLRRHTAAPGGFLLFGVDDIDELWLQGGSAHQETINVLLGAQLFASTAGHGPWGEDSVSKKWIKSKTIPTTDTCPGHRPP